ncbi:MAG: hypothetical protein Ta2B_15380 [Termitinemataceae bacterium]|nr:MAG: hypothetical protein Ta2B_15380 [Termitinemataceae bacterium]
MSPPRVKLGDEIHYERQGNRVDYFGAPLNTSGTQERGEILSGRKDLFNNVTFMAPTPCCFFGKHAGRFVLFVSRRAIAAKSAS